MIIFILKVVISAFVINLTSCTISGTSYMDQFQRSQYQNEPVGDPCNPPYWYPRYIPEYCFEKPTSKPKTITPSPVPIPVPHPIAYSPMYPLSYSYPINFSPLSSLHVNMPLPIQSPLPVGKYFPIQPAIAGSGVPYQSLYASSKQIGMIPGLPGIVSPDGGVNILPFSDAYSDLLEKHKRKTLRKRMKKILQDYKMSSLR